MMKTKESVECERTMKKVDYNIDFRKECENNDLFKKEFIECICASKELIKYMFKNMFLKDVPFSILQPTTEDEINSLRLLIGELDETFPKMGSMNDTKK